MFHNKSTKFLKDCCLGTQVPYSYQAETKRLPPEGYVPIYVCYLGRHCGSGMEYRQDTEWVCAVLSCAYEHQSLTLRGLELLSKMLGVMSQKERHLTTLNPEGVKYLEGIAQRMRYRYPEIFTKPVYAYSTRENQTTESRNLFLKELIGHHGNRQNQVHTNGRMDSVLRGSDYHLEYQQYLKEGAYCKAAEQFEDRNHPQDRILARIFHSDFFRHDCLNEEEKKRFVTALFHIYMNQIDANGEISLGYYFTPMEQYYYWENMNYWQYCQVGPGMPQNGLCERVTAPLRKEIMDHCDEAVYRHNRGADLYFGYEKTLMQFVTMMHLPDYSERTENPYKVGVVWKNYQIAPMCGNLQWIFYENRLVDKVLVKVQLNEMCVELPIETSVYPYYDWDDVRNYYKKL